MTTLERDVSRETFAEKGSAFIARAGGKGFVIAQRKAHKGKAEIEATPKQWNGLARLLRHQAYRREMVRYAAVLHRTGGMAASV